MAKKNINIDKKSTDNIDTGVDLLKIGGVLKSSGLGGAATFYNKDWKKSALYSGLGSAGGTALINTIVGAPAAVTGITAAMAGAKGAVAGGLMAGGRDTLFKNTVVPAAVVAASTPLTNYVLDVGYNDSHPGSWNIDTPVSVGITTALGGGLWAARNWKNKNKQWI